MTNIFDFIIQPKWVKQMPTHLRPTQSQIKHLEALRKQIKASHEEFENHIMSHPKTTEKSVLYSYELIKNSGVHLSESDLLARVLLERAKLNAMYGVTAFDIDLTCEPEKLEEQALKIVLPFQSVYELAAWIDQQEALAGPVIPSAPEYAWAAEEITKILNQ